MRATQDQMEARLEELQRIADDHDGELDPHEIVAHAKDQGSALHSYFEWDNKSAAHNYRLWQARKLIASFYVEMEGKRGRTVVTRRWVNVNPASEEDEQRYVDIDKALGNPTLRDQLLAMAQADMNRFRRKYRTLEELAAVMEAMATV